MWMIARVGLGTGTLDSSKWWIVWVFKNISSLVSFMTYQSHFVWKLWIFTKSDSILFEISLKFSQFSRSAPRARYLCQINRFSHKTSKFSYTFHKLFSSCNICPPFKPKKENTGLLFTLDYRIWRVWKEPGHVTGSLNSWDHVQVGNFSPHFYHFSCCSDFFLRVDYD